MSQSSFWWHLMCDVPLNVLNLLQGEYRTETGQIILQIKLQYLSGKCKWNVSPWIIQPYFLDCYRAICSIFQLFYVGYLSLYFCGLILFNSTVLNCLSYCFLPNAMETNVYYYFINMYTTAVLSLCVYMLMTFRLSIFSTMFRMKESQKVHSWYV